MKHTLQQVFGSPKFVVGFIIFMFIILTVIIYPLFVPDEPLEIIEVQSGTYFGEDDILRIEDAYGR